MGQTIVEDILGSSGRGQSINSKQKGNRNEIVAAKWLKRWTGQGFARTPSSGGLRWGQDASFACGDVVCQNQNFDFLFSVETKFVKNFSLGPRSVLVTFWKQAHEDAQRAGKMPLLMARKNGMSAGKYIICFDLLFKDICPPPVILNSLFIGINSDELLNLSYEHFTHLVRNLPNKK